MSTNFTIIRDAKKLNAEISAVVKLGATYRTRLHVAMVSAMVHAAEFGQCAPLQRIYDSLTVNDQQAFRGSYIRRVHAALGGLNWAEYLDKPVPEEIRKAAETAGAWLIASQTDGKTVFKVKSKSDQAAEARQNFIGLAEQELINPVLANGWARFFDRNNLVEIQVFGNKQVLAGLKTLEGNAAGDSERKEAHVHPDLLGILHDARQKVEAWYGVNGDVFPNAPEEVRPN